MALPLTHYGMFGGSTPLLGSSPFGLDTYMGGGWPSLSGYGGYGGIAPYSGRYGGLYGIPNSGLRGSMSPFDMSPFLDPYGDLDEVELERAYHAGVIDGSQYNQIILMVGGGRRRRHSWWPCVHRGDPMVRMMTGSGMGGLGSMMGGGLGFGGGFGRRNVMSMLIPGRRGSLDWPW